MEGEEKADDVKMGESRGERLDADIILAQSKGSTATQGNFLKATVAALSKTYQFQSPDLWSIIPPGQTPYDEYASHLRLAAQKAANY